MRARNIMLALGIFLTAPTALAQTVEPKRHEQQPTANSGPFAVSIYGAFRRMVHTKDYSPKVPLETVVRGGATEGVGAVAGLRGEITIIDGKMLLTYGVPCSPCAPPEKDHATLLATAKVSSWREPITLPTTLRAKGLDDFILSEARKSGLDVSKPFPVRLAGTLLDVKMHVLRAPNPNFKGPVGHSPSHGGAHGGMADQDVIQIDHVEGEIVGFYAPPEAQGIITHPGEPFHYHWIDKARTRTAHLDQFALMAGATLRLPLR